MAYKRLDFAQYFIDNGEDYNQTGRKRREIQYQAVRYQCDGFEKCFRIVHEVNYEIHYEEDRDVIQLNFQKSNGKSDWFANIFEFSSKYYDAFEFHGEKIILRAHHGWAQMYKTIKKDVRRQWKQLHELHPSAATEVVGWSLGSSQAILCCQDLNYNFGVRPYLYTYGSVRPFKSTWRNREKIKSYLNQICAECWNFANRNDVVTYMPPFRGFSMIRRVEIGLDKRTMKRLLHPQHYHTIYDQEELYEGLGSK